MANEQTPLFIHDWQELRDQVRRMRASFTIVRVSADGVLRSKQAISLLQHSQSGH